MDIITKICSKCHQEKLVKEFYPSKYKKDGYRSSCIICCKQWNSEHKKERTLYDKQRYLKNKEQTNLRGKKYHLEHKEEIRICQRKYQKHKMKTDINYRIYRMCQAMIHNALKGNSKSNRTMTYLMCSRQEFKEHIEKQWEPWMNWSNYGSGPGTWQIDHFIPKVFFNILDEVEKYMCCRYQNLRPLSWEDNMAKSKKIII